MYFSKLQPALISHIGCRGSKFLAIPFGTAYLHRTLSTSSHIKFGIGRAAGFPLLCSEWWRSELKAELQVVGDIAKITRGHWIPLPNKSEHQISMKLNVMKSTAFVKFGSVIGGWLKKKCFLTFPVFSTLCTHEFSALWRLYCFHALCSE